MITPHHIFYLPTYEYDSLIKILPLEYKLYILNANGNFCSFYDGMVYYIHVHFNININERKMIIFFV